jgi:glycosyltransferase involved in cell wall biosynthesis
VTEIQNLIPHLPRRYIWTDRVLRSITDLCISPAPAITAYARDVIGYPAEKLLELPTNAVDEHRFAAPINREEIRASIGIPPHAKLILSVGRLIEQKGHTFLLRALPLVLGEVPDVFVAIAGDGELREPLREEARRLGIANRVKLLGARHDVPNLLRSADVFVFPSLYEGQGLVLFETIFARLPIVASDVGGIPDAIEDGETGLLAQPGNPESLAKALIRMLRDGQLRKKVSDEAFRRYSNRTVGESAKRLAEVFGKLYDRKVSRKT